MSTASTNLPEGAGYGVVVGVGSEEFNTASRSVKPSLIANGIVSAWTWAATLLQSSTVAYLYGVAGPFWYATGATVQILMFSILACNVKQNAPRCHTYLEIIYIRYGATAHIIFMIFAFVTNVLVGSQLLLGGSAVVTSLTGMNVYAAIFLIPTGVCAYVILGGLRATFLCDYSHTLILMIIILYFMFNAYATNPLIGSPSEMYELLKAAAAKRPVAGNEDGSYLTLKSNFALIFGVIQLCSGSGTVFLDQAYWQRAIASRPTTANIHQTRRYAQPAHIRFSPHDRSLRSHYGCIRCIWNVAGIDLGWLFLVMGLLIGGAVFPTAFAITWRGQTRIRAISGCLSGLAAGLIAWLTTAKTYCGELTVTTTGHEYPTLAGNLAAVCTGCIVTVAVSLIKPDTFDWDITRAINTPVAEREIAAGIEGLTGRASTEESPSAANFMSEKPHQKSKSEEDNSKTEHRASLSTIQAEEKEHRLDLATEDDPSSLRGAFKLACIASFVMTLIMDFLVPMPMFFSHYIFSKGFFTGWIVISFIWVFVSSFVSTILPVWETREFFRDFAGEVWRDLTRRRRKKGNA
ncbi:hypothetical protein GQ43DRAFT_477020 [Delitschia confertaspora ATCC 74209]|uniref:Transporter, SSS family n=1 Tax=Delitschia confertaspora ATCC 74209 TaxID=1513339 RepID=A0A9P4JVI7_9PLEO|nr:hypothetical protein GQ43DRAFT_477020 [Delitschia confertaspora ATCC 74209]